MLLPSSVSRTVLVPLTAICVGCRTSPQVKLLPNATRGVGSFGRVVEGTYQVSYRTQSPTGPKAITAQPYSTLRHYSAPCVKAEVPKNAP